MCGTHSLVEGSEGASKQVYLSLQCVPSCRLAFARATAFPPHLSESCFRSISQLPQTQSGARLLEAPRTTATVLEQKVGTEVPLSAVITAAPVAVEIETPGG